MSEFSEKHGSSPCLDVSEPCSVPGCNLGFSMAFDQRRLFTPDMTKIHTPSRRPLPLRAPRAFEAATSPPPERQGNQGAIGHHAGKPGERSGTRHVNSRGPQLTEHRRDGSWRSVPAFRHHGGMSSLSLFIRPANEGRSGRRVRFASRRFSSRTVFLKSMAGLPGTSVSEPCPVPACSLRCAEDT